MVNGCLSATWRCPREPFRLQDTPQSVREKGIPFVNKSIEPIDNLEGSQCPVYTWLSPELPGGVLGCGEKAVIRNESAFKVVTRPHRFRGDVCIWWIDSGSIADIDALFRQRSSRGDDHTQRFSERRVNGTRGITVDIELLSYQHCRAVCRGRSGFHRCRKIPGLRGRGWHLHLPRYGHEHQRNISRRGCGYNCHSSAGGANECD
jgi:hypothetical protein